MKEELASQIEAIRGSTDTSLLETRILERAVVFREQGNKRNVAGDLAYLARLTRERGGSDVVWRESIRATAPLPVTADDRLTIRVAGADRAIAKM